MSMDTTAQQLAGSALRSLRRLYPLGRAKVAPRRHLRVLAGIDSLTAGGGDPFSSYIPTLATRLKRRLGDGGPGLYFFDVLSPGYYHSAGGGVATSFIVTDPAWDSGARSHSLCGRGLSITGAAGGSVGLDPGEPWDFCRIYFEIAAGGSFSAVNGGAGAAAVSVSGATHATSVLCAVDLASTQGNTSLAIYSVNGGVNFFGADFLSGSGGVTVSNCGLSGSFLGEHASLDDGWARQWARTLRADAYLLDGGMNDRFTVTAAGYSEVVNKVVDRWQSAGTEVLLIRPNDSSDAASTYLAEYDRVLKTTAAARGCAFLDDRDALGVYAAATTAGFMADAIHPSATGNARRAAAYDKALF